MVKSQELEPGKSAFAINANLSSNSSISPQKGYTKISHSLNVDDKILRKFTYERGRNFKSDIRVRDNASNAIVEYLNPGDDRNSSKGQWSTLLAGLTKDTDFGFTPFNDTGTDKLLWCNAIENFRSWSGAICLMDGAVLASASSITVKKVTGDPKTNPTDDFPSSGSITYIDTAGVFKSLAYSSKTATVFTMSTPSNTTASAGNTGVADVTIDESSIPKNNILITAQGRVNAAGRTDLPNQVQGSLVSDYTNWTAGTTPDSAFAKDFPDGGKITALASKDAWIFVGKTERVLAFTFLITVVEDGSGGTVKTKDTFEKLVARIGIAHQKAVAFVGNDIFFISPKGQIRRLFNLEAENEFSTLNINGEIRPSLVGSVFDDASLEYLEDKDLLIASFKKDSNSSVNDFGEFIYFVKDNLGNIKNINISFHDWFMNDMNVIDGKLKFGSGVESEDFEAFNGLSKNGAPYLFRYITRIEDGGDIKGLSTFVQKYLTHFLVKGSIAGGTTLNFILKYDDNGATATTTFSLSDSDGTPYIVQQPFNALNSLPLNSAPLGGSLEDIAETNPFKVFFPLSNKYRPFNWQLEFNTDGAGQNVEIDTHAFEMSEASIKFPNPLYKKGVG